MNTTITVISIALLIIIAAALITKKSSNYKANVSLAFAYVCLACVLIYLVMVETNGKMPHWLAHSDFIFFYFTIPLIYMYVALATGLRTGFRLKHTIHLLPVMPGVANYILYHVHGPVNEGDFQALLPYSQVAIMIHLTGLTILTIYLVQSFRLIYAYNQKVKVSEYPLARQQILWLKTLFPLFMVPCFILFLSVAGLPMSAVVSGATNLVCFSMFSFLLVRQFHFSDCIFNNEQNKAEQHTHKTKPTRQKEFDEYNQRLTEIMEEKLLFLNPDLSAETVAKQMHLSQSAFSQVVFEVSGKHFPEYVKNYRIQYALYLLDDPSNLKWNSIFIAEKCGFKNRENLSKSFKKIMGISFDKYHQQLKQKKSKIE